MTDKRIYERLKSDTKLKLLFNGSNNLRTGVLDNFSQDGICALLDRVDDIVEGNYVDIEFELEGVLLKISSRVKWIDLNNRLVGLEYITDVHSSYHNVVQGFYHRQKRGFFLTEVRAYLKDINLYGTGYFSRYFEWQGIAREEYFLTVPNANMLMQSGVKLITKHAWTDYVNHCFVFDLISIKIQNRNIKNYSFEMIFTFFNSKTKQIIARGGQVLVFSDPNGKLIKIPEQILSVISNHKIS